MNTKKYLIGAGVVAIIITGASSLVLANDMMQQGQNMMQGTNNNQHEYMVNKAMMGEHEGPEMVVQIGPNGKTTLRGTIKTVGTNILTVTSWGGDWVVNVSTSTNVMPSSDLTQFKVGDFVGVQGMVNQSASWTIDARIVRDWTSKKMMQENQMMQGQDHEGEKKNENGGSQGIQQQIQYILEQIKKIQAQINVQQGQTVPSTQSGQ